MSWENVTITNDGEKLLSKMMNGSKLLFTRVVVGDRTVNNAALSAQTSVFSPISAPALIAGKSETPQKNGTQIRIQIRNDGVTETSRMRQIGLYAKSEHDGEVLFGILQDEIGEEIPAYADFPQFLIELYATVAVSRTNNIQVVVSPSVYATVEELQEVRKNVADLKAYIGYTDSDIYGLEADFENNKFTRLAGAVGKEPGADFDSVRAFGGRRRCCLTNAGEVKAYYGDDGYDEDGMLASQGELVQVMVEQPKFYYKVVPLKTEKIDGADGYHLRKARYYISDTPKAGFKVHPAFVRNGAEVDRIYLAAYEGCIRDMHSTSHGYIRDNAQIMDADADQLSSIVNALPATGITQALTRENARELAHNRGAGWELTTIQSVSATQLLFAIEYATFNSQNAIGTGIVNATETIKTGSTSSLGNASGSAASGGVSYRGEENLWGNVWAWCDGSNIQSNNGKKIYISDHDFVDDKGTSPYKDTGIIPCSANGYISAFGYFDQYDWLFAASDCVGNSSLPIGDYQWVSDSGWCTDIVGGCVADGIRCGIFCRHLGYASTYKYWRIGARLTYFPQNTEEVVSE